MTLAGTSILDESAPIEPKIRYRVFRYSIHVLFYRFSGNSRPYKISGFRDYVLPALWYSFITLLLGFWGWGPFTLFRRLGHTRKSIEAIHINFAGGEDYTQLIENMAYPEKTNYIWNNLLKSTKNALTKEIVQMVTEIQEEYQSSGGELFSDENIDYIHLNLSKVSSTRIRKFEMEDVFEAMKMHDRFIEDQNSA